MRRNPESVLSKCFPIVINGAMLIALVASYAMYRYFSIGALFATIGTAVAFACSVYMNIPVRAASRTSPWESPS